MATFTNETGFPLKLCSWDCELPGLYRTYTVDIPAGGTRSMPISKEYVILHENYQELGKYITNGAYGNVKWWSNDVSFQVLEKDDKLIIMHIMHRESSRV
jgi:hypothetical protein